MPLLSVIVPVYNVEKYLEQCVESILSQSFSDLELLLVDDGSPDGSPALCDAWAEKDPRVRVIHQKNSGVVAARQAGVAKAEGEYISFVDGDDFVAPQMMEKMLSRLQEEDADYVVCGCVLYWNDRTIAEPCVDAVMDARQIREKMIPEYIGERTERCAVKGYVGRSICRRNLSAESIEQVPRQMKIREDRLQVLHILAKCNRLVLLKDCFYYYRQREDSAVGAADAFTGENADRFWRHFAGAVEKYGYGSIDVARRLEQEKVQLVRSVFFSDRSYGWKCMQIRELRRQLQNKRSLLSTPGDFAGRMIGWSVWTGTYPVLLVIQKVVQKIRRTV